MTKAEYMEALQKKLECFNRELQQEIVEDYEQHFAEGIAAGKTEEELVAELGSIEDMIQELPEEDLSRDDITVRVPGGPEVRISGGTGAGQPETARGKEDRKDDACPEETCLRKTYPGEYKGIIIDGAVADVKVEHSDDGQIHVEYQNKGGKGYRFYQHEEDGVFYTGVRQDKEASAREAKRAVKIMLFGKTLNVDMDNCFSFGKSFSWSSSDEISLNIRIPAGVPRLEIKTLSGDVRVSDVNPEQLSLNSTSGDIEIRHVTTDRLKLNTTSGDVTGDQIYSGDMDMHTASGDVELNGGEMGMLRLQTASGDFSGERMRGNSIAVVTGSGDADFNGCFERYNVRTGSGDVDLRAEPGAAEIRVGTGSGDVDLDLTALESTEITVSTGSGDAAIYGSGGVRHQVTMGTTTVGSGDCKVYVSTGSGDAEIRKK
ncbi:MAG: DUF4097 family beta strand repeat-containing protein [Butyrivibrio sp.]|nr:DUF4097 family beta strand repeat-containing protein [Acetatifactor muris]MCM1559023.1 DUF4097 family beta strand repeat-containing protein [Butyrivibrio sp.]